MSNYFNMVTIGQVGVSPAILQLTTSESLATVTTAGWLDSKPTVEKFSQNDFVLVLYNYNPPSSYGTIQWFTASISSGVTSLSQYVNTGNVTPPVVSGDFAVFDGTTSKIKDSGYLPSNAAKTNVVMATAATTIGQFAAFTDIAGTIGNLGALFKTTGTYGGGGTSNAFTATGLTSAYLVVATILSQANAATIVKAVPGTNTLTITFSADPGAGTTVSYFAVPAAI